MKQLERTILTSIAAVSFCVCVGCSTGTGSGAGAVDPRADMENIVAEDYPAALFLPAISTNLIGGIE
jgi:hypothetical protein